MNQCARITLILLFDLTFISGCAAPATPAPDFSRYFQERNVKGAFLLYDADKAEFISYCPDQRCEQRFIPASTFKLLNAQIALETGVIADENEIIPWDGVERGIAAWNQDHNLRTAMQNSVVWFYQELAHRIDPERMQHYIDLVGYGNRDISGPDPFWLEGNLRISQAEQIEFLRRLYEEDLPFSQSTMQTVKDIILLEETPAYRLSGKTGWASSVDPDVGWFVGYVEKNSNVYYFATNIDDEGSEESLGKISREITEGILAELGILPTP